MDSERVFREFEVDAPAGTEGDPIWMTRAASVRQLVAESLRGKGREPEAGETGSRQEKAALGAAVAILGACLEDEAVGPLPELTAGLVELILTPAAAAR